MISKYISENNLKNFFASKSFLIYNCAAIFLLSLFLRSLLDVGSDTLFYIDIGKKISNGGKYYYNFFESNFPLSFYFYALEHQISSLLGINEIIFSEIIINSLALLSIFGSGKILKKSTIYDDKAYYNLIIISYFLGFFLRPNALQVSEFGTKTSLLLICLYPYLSYSFVRKIPFSKIDLICRGCLMGIMPCLKPHYLILIIFIEFYNFWKTKNYKFFIELDKLIMVLIGVSYLFLMIKFTPEFFEFIVPLWPEIYPAYNDINIFIKNALANLAERILLFAFIFLIFSRIKLGENNKILGIFFISTSLLVISENINTIDQITTFFAITTICFVKFTYDLFLSRKFLFQDNKFIICGLIFLPIFDIKSTLPIIIGFDGLINCWWIIALFYPFFLANKYPQIKFSKKTIIIALALYLLAFISALKIMKNGNIALYVSFNFLFLLIFLFIFEKKIYSKISNKFSTLSVFTITTIISCLIYCYIGSIVDIFRKEHDTRKILDIGAYYTKTYAPRTEDSFLSFSQYFFRHSAYLGKENYYKFSIIPIMRQNKQKGSFAIFPINNLDYVFVGSYFMEDLKKLIKDPRIKLIFVNNNGNHGEALDSADACLVGTLEYYFLDLEFKKLFLQNFRFENRILLSKKVNPLKIKFLIDSDDIFKQVKPSEEIISRDFEVYVRKEIINENTK